MSLSTSSSSSTRFLSEQSGIKSRTGNALYEHISICDEVGEEQEQHESTHDKHPNHHHQQQQPHHHRFKQKSSSVVNDDDEPAQSGGIRDSTYAVPDLDASLADADALVADLMIQQHGSLAASQHEESDHEDAVFLSVDDAIELLGMGRYQYGLLVASGLCFAADAMQVVSLSFLTPVLQSTWNLPSEVAASLTSAIFAGAMIGTLILGPMADTWGRRPIFLLAAAMITVFSCGMALSRTIGFMLLMIFMVGFGVGGLTVPFDILAEFLPSAGRGTNLLLIEYFWTLGCLYVVVVAYSTLHSGDGMHHHHGEPQWRLMIALCAFPCLLSLVIGAIFLPESARWLVSQGRQAEALHVLRRAATMNGQAADQNFGSHVRLACGPNEHERQGTLMDLLSPPWRNITLRLWGTWAAFAFGYYGTILATTRVFEQHGHASINQADSNSTMAAINGTSQVEDSSSMIAQSAGFDFDYSAIFVSSSAELIGTTLVIVAVDRVGRIPSQVVSYAIAGTAVSMLCFLASHGNGERDDRSSSLRWLLIAFGFVARVFEMAGTCVSWVSTAEIFTTKVRGTGHATANAMARLGAFFSPYVVEGQNVSLQRLGVVMLIVHACTVMCVYKLPETKGRCMGVMATADDHPSRRDEHAALGGGRYSDDDAGGADDLQALRLQADSEHDFS